MSNIVWIASYPKSGNTWIRAFLHHWLADAKAPQSINALKRFFESESWPGWYQPYTGQRQPWTLDIEEIAAIRCHAQQDLASSRPGTVLVKTHHFLGEFRGHPLHRSEVTAGAVYVLRNPLDVVLSLADHHGLTLDQAVDFMGDPMTATASDEANLGSILGSWSLHVQSWTRPDPSVLVLRYEDMVERPARAFNALLRHLGQPEDPQRLARARRFSAFDALKAQERSSGFVERSPSSKWFFRNGKAGQWRQALSRPQIEQIISTHREQMQRFDYLPPGFR